jgi:RNA polymerase sigma-70 factor (ECF subfamily)
MRSPTRSARRRGGGAAHARGTLRRVTTPSDATSDADLVRAIAAGGGPAVGGDPAEAHLCRRFAPRIRLYGLRHLHDEERARDLVQSVLLAVLVAARAGRVEDPERIDRFILGTCRNTSMRMREVDARAASVATEELDVAVFLPETERIETGALVRCLGALDARSRTVVHLSFHEQRSADEIAKALETTPGNVRVVRHRAIASLRRCLDGAGASSHGEAPP